MNTLRLTVVGICIAAPVPALAAPAFLSCTLVDKDGPSRFDVQVNEEAGTVSYYADRTKVLVTVRAIFTPQVVTFNTFTIDRRDLSFRRDNDPEEVKLFGWPPVDRGTCKVDSSKRAF